SLLITWCLLRVADRCTAARGAVLGFVVGVSVLLNESFATLAVLVPVAVAWLAPSASRAAAAVIAFFAGACVAPGPLVARNVAVGVPPLAIALQGTVVYAFFNAGDSSPTFFGAAPASLARLLAASEQRLGRLMWLCLQSFDGVADVAGFYL